MPSSPTLLIMALALSFAAAWCDLRTGQIPNSLTLGGLGLGAVLQVWWWCTVRGAGEVTWGPALLASAVGRVGFGVVACGLVPYLLFLRGGMGGGDVKLLAALGAALGPASGLELELYAFLLLAVVAPLPLLYRGDLGRVLANSAAMLLNPLRPKAQRREVSPELLVPLKFGPAVFAATALLSFLRWRST